MQIRRNIDVHAVNQIYVETYLNVYEKADLSMSTV